MINARCLHHNSYLSIQLLQQVVKALQFFLHMQHLEWAAHDLSIGLKNTDSAFPLRYIHSNAYHPVPPETDISNCSSRTYYHSV